MRKNLKLGLFGFGCVGQGLYSVLQETEGIRAEVKKICVKTKDKVRPLADDLFTFKKEDILNDPSIDVVVELIDDADAAFEIVKTALQNGKAVVTANKKMLAENLQEIYSLQQQYGKPVLYEGSVCASIPIIRNLEEYYDNDLITSIEGIFNGSTNYILTKVFEEKKSYEEALVKAQELGFAESNPKLDVEGFDAKYKLVIAIAHTFGTFVTPDEVINIGIDRITDVDLKFAREKNYSIKLIARAVKQNGKIFALVAPQFVEQLDPLANIRNEYNAVQVEGVFAEKQLFVGKGAGSYPTGSAVLSDVSALSYDYHYEYKKLKQVHDTRFTNAFSVEAFVSFTEGTAISIQDFETFTSGYASGNKQYMVGTATLENLQKWSKLEGVGIILAPHSEIIAHSKVAQAALAF